MRARGWVWLIGSMLGLAACAPRPAATVMPLATATAAPPAVVATVALPTVTPAPDLPSPTPPPAVADLLPTPTAGPLIYTSKAGGFRLHLPLPWRAVTPDLDLAEPLTGTAELAAIRPGDGARAAATFTLAVIPAHGLTLEQWRDATAAEMVRAGFAIQSSDAVEIGGNARMPAARLTYQLPRRPNAVPEVGVQVAWFAPDDRLAVATLTLGAAEDDTARPEIDAMLAALAFITPPN